MNISEIKSELGIETIQFVRDTDKSGQPTEWARDWKNAKRLAVVTHMDNIPVIATSQNLAYKTVEKTGASGTYQLANIYEYDAPSDVVLAV